MVLDPVKHEKLPITGAFVRLKFLAVEPLHQFQNQDIADIRVLRLVVRINDDCIRVATTSTTRII